MAIMTTGRTAPVSGASGFNIDRYQAAALFSYDHVTYNSTVIRGYDNSANDVVVTGTGFTHDANLNPTGGTVTSMILRVNGVAEFKLQGLSLDLMDFHALAQINNSPAAWALALEHNDTISGTGFNDRLRGFDGADSLYGNGGADQLYGGSGNDRLIGGPGADRLEGGTGADRFIYTAVTQGNDVVAGFGTDDFFVFEGSAFKLGAYAGILKPGNFIARAADHHAADANDYFIFNRADDTLWFDKDGSGVAAAVKMADLSNDFSLTAGDILIV